MSASQNNNMTGQSDGSLNVSGSTSSEMNVLASLIQGNTHQGESPTPSTGSNQQAQLLNALQVISQAMAMISPQAQTREHQQLSAPQNATRHRGRARCRSPPHTSTRAASQHTHTANCTSTLRHAQVTHALSGAIRSVQAPSCHSTGTSVRLTVSARLALSALARAMPSLRCAAPHAVACWLSSHARRTETTPTGS